MKSNQSSKWTGSKEPHYCCQLDLLPQRIPRRLLRPPTSPLLASVIIPSLCHGSLLSAMSSFHENWHLIMMSGMADYLKEYRHTFLTYVGHYFLLLYCAWVNPDSDPNLDLGLLLDFAPVSRPALVVHCTTPGSDLWLIL